jgi:hypothetical protein
MDGSSSKGLDLQLLHPIYRVVTLLILSWASFLALDQFPWFIMMELGFNLGFIPILILIRTLFADRLTGLSQGFLGLSHPKYDWRSLALAALLFGVPLFTLYFIFGSTPPFLSPFVSLAWFTIRGGLIYEFPRLLLFDLVTKHLILANGPIATR